MAWALYLEFFVRTDVWKLGDGTQGIGHRNNKNQKLYKIIKS